MPAYAVAHLRQVNFGPEIVEYLERIDATLAPFDGRFLVHGGRVHELEGTWQGDLIVIEFPSLERARSWYMSPGYQRILELRTDNAVGEVFLIEGVPPGYRAAHVLTKMPGRADGTAGSNVPVGAPRPRRRHREVPR